MENVMIPRVIHYCWFGGKPLSDEVIFCINTWKKYCPDYEIKRWDESNFNLNDNPYTREAYSVKKWAFVSDYARLKIVYECGGIYLDTDVELIEALDSLLDNEFFFAIEKDSNPETGVINVNVATGLGFGAEKENLVLKALLNEYNDVHFLDKGNMDLTPCPIRNTRALLSFGFVKEDIMQRFENGTIYPSEYFCPVECSTRKENFTKNTISIHHYDASWKSNCEKVLYSLRLLKRKIIGSIKNVIR